MTKGYTPEGYVFTANYDAVNRLKTIDYADNAFVAHHTDFYYSADGMLAREVVDGVETRFVRDGFLTLQERDGSNNVTRTYVWDPRAPGGIGGLLELGQGGLKYSYLFDGKGNVNALLDGTQATTATYSYDEFGNLMLKGGTLDQPFRFSTKPYDEKTGLSYYGYRFYAPTLGRWMNRDPLGEKGGFNLYGFVQNNPVNYVDPYGLNGLLSGLIDKIGDLLPDEQKPPIPKPNEPSPIPDPDYVVGFKKVCAKLNCNKDSNSSCKGPWLVKDIKSDCWCEEWKIVPYERVPGR